MKRRAAVWWVVVLVAAIVLFAGSTWWALEAGGVAVVRTQEPGGSMHSSHVWYVQHNGQLWLEAGSPKNKWFVDLRYDPKIRLQFEGSSRRYTAHISKSVAVRLEPIAESRNLP